MKIAGHVVKVHLEGTVSQIFDLGPRYFIL